ncbi:MAG: lipocalin family protein [Chitinophagaceae bacterium]
MKLIKKYFLFNFFLVMSCTVFSQKQTFDVLSFSVPRGWQQQQNDAAIQLSVTDKKNNTYAMAIITKATASDASANENFTKQWNAAIKSSVKLDGEPTMQPPSKGNGWDIVTGNANYTDETGKGNVALLSATGNGQTVSVVVMTNTKQYENDLATFLNSLELSKPSKSAPGNAPAPTAGGSNPTSIVGLWADYKSETSGYFSNGSPMLTAGYFRKEYVFKADGTYLFRTKNWSVFMKEILFIYETGTWKVNGNQLTISPKQGRGEWWSKAASGRTSEWGSKLKASTYKLQTVTYTFELHYFSGTKETDLILLSNNPTERDGRSNNNNQPNRWNYSPRALDKSSIDNPPGMTTSFDSKPSPGNTSVQQTNTTASLNSNTPVAGKIWEGTSPEKFVGGTMNGYNTGGYFTWQYRFGADGSYRFVYVDASAYTNTNLLQYETGTYIINGNQLTITPAKGANEEWSIVGGPVKLSAMSDMQIRNIKEQWGKRIKTEQRKLERVTYSFQVEYQQGNRANALILQYNNGHTEREGNGKMAYYFETAEARSAKLPG